MSSSIFERDLRHSGNGMGSNYRVRLFTSCTFLQDALMGFASRVSRQRSCINARSIIRLEMNVASCGTIRRWGFAGRSASRFSHRKTKPIVPSMQWIRSCPSINRSASKLPLTRSCSLRVTKRLPEPSHRGIRRAVLVTGRLQVWYECSSSYP